MSDSSDLALARSKSEKRLSGALGIPVGPPPPMNYVAPSEANTPMGIGEVVRKRPISMSVSSDLQAQIAQGFALRKLGPTPPSPPVPQHAPRPAEEAIPTAPSAPLNLICGEAKGKEITLIFSPSQTVKEVVDATLKATTVKKPESLLPYLKDSGIYLNPAKTLASYLIKTQDKLLLKSKDKKPYTITVNYAWSGDKESVDCFSDTTAWGLIQLLTKRPAGLLSVIKDGKEIPYDSKLTSSGVKSGQTIDISLSSSLADDDAKGKGKKDKKVKEDKKANRLSMLRPSLSPSSSSDNLPSRDAKKGILDTFLKNRIGKDDLVKRGVMTQDEIDAATNGLTPLKLDVFVQLCNFLEADLELQGIFRISGPLGEVRELYAQFSKDGTLDLTAAKIDPHIATGALKLYLREQSEPLIPFSLYSEFLKAQKLPAADAQVQGIAAVFEKMAPPASSILKYLMGFLTKVAKREEKNLMSPTNLGIVFGPTIMWDPDTNAMNFENTGVQSALVATMINNYDAIFGGIEVGSSNGGAASELADSLPAPTNPKPPGGRPKTLPPLPPGSSVLPPAGAGSLQANPHPGPSPFPALRKVSPSTSAGDLSTKAPPGPVPSQFPVLRKVAPREDASHTPSPGPSPSPSPTLPKAGLRPTPGGHVRAASHGTESPLAHGGRSPSPIRVTPGTPPLPSAPEPVEFLEAYTAPQAGVAEVDTQATSASTAGSMLAQLQSADDLTAQIQLAQKLTADSNLLSAVHEMSSADSAGLIVALLKALSKSQSK